MDPAVIAIWLLRLLFLAFLYVFLWSVVRALLRDLHAAARAPATELGRLMVVAAPSGDPAIGTVFRLDAVTSIGRDVNSTIVLEDDFVSSAHAALTFRGRAWYVEDLGSTNGTFVNGVRIDELAPVAFGDEIQVGQVRLRLERTRG